MLFTNSLRQAQYAWVVHALALAEAALLVILITEHVFLNDRAEKNEKAKKICLLLHSGSQKEYKKAIAFMSKSEGEELAATLCAALPASSALAFDAKASVEGIVEAAVASKEGVKAAVAAVEGVAKALGGVRATLKQGPAKKGAKWYELAKESLEADVSKRQLDLVILLLNWVAFVGYGAICVTYYYDAPELYANLGSAIGLSGGADDLVWYGNFAGDFAWTLEPSTILTRSFILGW
mmetsp:Transcript_45178/g.141555  ORF Transcript_45178/g.141555 Transcript_45178/m.141555 type:complete len:237 (+) Transcript_45178:154-864(+)